MAGSRDYFPKTGTAQVSSTYGVTQDSVIILSEETVQKSAFPILESAGYTGQTTWNAGQLAAWNAGGSGNVEKGTTITGQVLGMLYNDRNANNDETQGSNEVTVITGPHGMEFLTNQVDAADTFTVGLMCFMNVDGNFSTTDGTGPRVAEVKKTKASDGFVHFIWRLGAAVT